MKDLSVEIAERLRQNLEKHGSMEFLMTWKEHLTPAGRRLFRLVPSTRRTSGKDCSGWPTPRSTESTESTQTQEAREARGTHASKNLQSEAMKAGWNSPRATDGSNGGPNQAGGALSNDAAKAGWTTPQAHDVSPRGKGQKAKHGTAHGCADLNADALQVSGPIGSGTNAVTEKPGESQMLNPFFSGYLQGYGTSWTIAGLRAVSRLRAKSKAARRSSKVTATPSSRHSQRSSSKPI